jgi:hypothetical protein
VAINNLFLYNLKQIFKLSIPTFKNLNDFIFPCYIMLYISNINMFIITVTIIIIIKAIPERGREGPQGCEMLSIPHCLDNQITDGDEIVSLTRRPRYTLQDHYLLFLVIIFVRG